MYFTNTTACISSILLAIASASVPTSFELLGASSGVDTTTVFETTTYYLTSAITVTNPPIASISASSAAMTSSEGYAAPPAEATFSLHEPHSKSSLPATLSAQSSTTASFPQNSTAFGVPTSYPPNGTSTVVITTTAASSSQLNTSATAPASASVSEVPINGADKVTGNVILGMGAVAAFMALL